MSNLPKPASNFGLISGIIGLTLCLSQAVKGHVDAKNERERLQEAHEQKMHFLHEFHRQQLHVKDHEIVAIEHRVSARDMERRAKEAEERAERLVGRLGGLGAGIVEDKEREVWRLMGSAREGKEGGEGSGKEMEDGR